MVYKPIIIGEPNIFFEIILNQFGKNLKTVF